MVINGYTDFLLFKNKLKSKLKINASGDFDECNIKTKNNNGFNYGF